MANGKTKDGDKEAKRARKRDAANESVRDRARVAMRDADQGQVIAAVASVALVLGAGLGVLLFGASRKRAAGGSALPGNAALGGNATGDLTSLAADGPIAGAMGGQSGDPTTLAADGPIEGSTQNETGTDVGDWYAMREGAGGADAVASPGPASSPISNGAGEHVPTDLAPDTPRPDRAVEAFRPDRDAPVLPAERDAFAPATMPVPSRIEAMGNGDDD